MRRGAFGHYDHCAYSLNRYSVGGILSLDARAWCSCAWWSRAQLDGKICTALHSPPPSFPASQNNDAVRWFANDIWPAIRNEYAARVALAYVCAGRSIWASTSKSFQYGPHNPVKFISKQCVSLSRPGCRTLCVTSTGQMRPNRTLT